MSFSYWGADKVTLQKPATTKPRAVAANGGRKGGNAVTSYGRESSANAKFGTRLISGDSPNGTRPASRRTQATPVSRRQPQSSDESHSVRATVTREAGRPAWDGSTRAATTTPTQKRTRNTSQTSAAVKATTTTTKTLSSPAPSEDSGVGFYRQIIAQNPSLNRLNP